MIPAYSPGARGRCERSFGTWQNRLPQELRLAGIATLEQANAFLRERYIAEFNGKFAKPATEKGTAFRKCGRKDWDLVFSIQTGRTVAQDNTVQLRNTFLQLDKTRFRNSLAGCTVTLCEHLEGSVSDISPKPRDSHFAHRPTTTGTLKPRPKPKRATGQM